MVADKPTRATGEISLCDGLIAAGLDSRRAELFEQMPSRTVTVEPRRPFREPGAKRDEVMFVSSGLICKYRNDGLGRRQIIALLFPGEGILPREGNADYGIEAIARSTLMLGKVEDFEPIVDADPDLRKFFFRLVERHAAIGYEWLVNCGRRDSVARVAHLLCETAQRSGIDVVRDPLVNPFTQQQIADITGQTSVNVNRVFAELERKRLIRRDGRRIFFADPKEMERLAGFQANYLR